MTADDHRSPTPATDGAALSAETSAAADDLQVRRWRAMSSEQKALLIAGLCAAADTLALEAIRLRYPAASEHECFLRLAVLRLGPDLACRAYPDASALTEVA